MARPPRIYPSKSVLPWVPARTVNFVRHRDVVRLLAAEALARARLARFGQRTTEVERRNVLERIAQLERKMDGPAPALRILNVLLWYEDHCRDKYVPWVEGARSLYDKFARLEAAMYNRGDDGVSSADEVIGRLFNGSRVAASEFRSLLDRAANLRLGDDAEVARRLGAMHSAIRDARAGSPTFGLPGPLELIRRYLDWLGGRDWIMTARVLALDSRAFEQFRREEADLHPRGVDPLTGR